MITIVIPSYNSQSTIEKCINALYNQTYKGDFEVILADSSEDQTQNIVQEKFPLVKLISFKTKTDPGTARNAAIQQSKGDLILMIDSDCVANPDWMELMVETHQNDEYSAVGGSVINGNDPKCEVAWAGYIAEFREFLPGFKPEIREHIPTCNISYKRKVFAEEQFNPNYYPQEDLEFNYKLRLKGGQIFFNPLISVHHHHREQIKVFFGHQKKIGTITSGMLKILPLQGAQIARNKLLTLLAAPILPAVKFFKTLSIFYSWNQKFVFTHWKSFVIFALGLFPWVFGFISGSFSQSK